MTDRPILFSAPMIRALLAGRKTQTRRSIKPRGACSLFDGSWTDDYVLDPGNASWREKDISIKPGDRLWVREAFSYEWSVKDDPERRHLMPVWFWADGNIAGFDCSKPKPSIHMPRWASRLTLIVTDVCVQRLQDISEDDCWAEGVCAFAETLDHPGMWLGLDREDRRGLVRATYGDARRAFLHLWASVNGAESWDRNPWVAAYSFTVHRRNIEGMGAA